MRSRYWRSSESRRIPVAARRGRLCRPRAWPRWSWDDSQPIEPNPVRRPAGMRLNPPCSRGELRGWVDRPVDPVADPADIDLERPLALAGLQLRAPARALR